MIARLEPLRTVPTFLGAHEIPEEYRGRKQEYLRLVIDEMLPIRGETRRILRRLLRTNVFHHRRQPPYPHRRPRIAVLACASTPTSSPIPALPPWPPNSAPQQRIIWNTSTRAAFWHSKAAGVQPVLLPGSVYALASTRYPPARDMIAAGLAVVLATDFNPGSSPTPSMPMILSLACTQMKMTPAEAIAAATFNAACSLNRAHEIGSLQPGKLADFVIHDCADYREIPYFFGIQSARAVFIGGRCVSGEC